MRQHSQPIAIVGEALVDDFGASQVVGGAPFNVARHLAAFGAATLMITRIGNDAPGAAVREQFARFGVPEAGLQVDPRRPTGRVLVEQQGGSHRFTILPDQAYDHIDAAAALAVLGEPAMLYFGTLAQRGAVSRAALDRSLAATDASRYLDLNLRDGQFHTDAVLDAIRQADILKVNDEELAWLLAALGAPQRDATDDAACAALMTAFRLRGLVVTLGPRGALWQGADGTRLVAGAPERVDVVDTVGAGDAFSAVFLLGERRGWPRALTLARANAFAAAICGVRGAVPTDTAFHAAWLRQWAD